MTTKEKIKNLKNFASMDQSFKEWLTTCPRKYIWQINEVTKDQGTFTFSLIKEENESKNIDLEIIF
jgi:hypothetical protein